MRNNFIPDKDASVFVIVPPGESRSRALEQMRAAHDMGAEVIAICSAADVEIEKYADVLFPISGAHKRGAHSVHLLCALRAVLMLSVLGAQ
ncbi:MAG: hypothetical protein SAMD01599839_08710 [Rectinema sp.]